MVGADVRPSAAGAMRPWPLVGAFALLAAVNLLNNVVAPGLYLLWACLAIAGLVLLARADGLDPHAWGMGPVTRRTARAAVALAAVTASVLLVGTQLPGIDSAYLDDRVAGMTGGQIAFAVLVRVPVGTALLEEIAFRGVLLAMLARRFGTAWGVAGSSLAFGVWHVAPSLTLAAGNAAVGSALGAHPLWAAASGVVAAAFAGAMLCALRIRYDHLIAPLAVHMTSNGLGYLLAWLMVGS